MVKRNRSSARANRMTNPWRTAVRNFLVLHPAGEHD
jgi:hypothetical protein